ncbi:phosphotransferase [Nitrincola sp. A-D6]|uniref:phosphotransferase n=1 Tax=Nitrincola sp. A-D6 TaxID=1545442 RepID=UPI000689E056|nr:phosphotransferase [Nitrincola sp. A-D6]
MLGTLERLPGERDSNFCLSVSPGKRFMVRFINAAEADTEIDFQTRMLIYLQERAAHLPLPGVVKSISGECQPKVTFSGQKGALRVVSYLEGTPFYQHAPITDLARQLGGILGEMDHAWQTFLTLGRSVSYFGTLPIRSVYWIEFTRLMMRNYAKPLPGLSTAIVNV